MERHVRCLTEAGLQKVMLYMEAVALALKLDKVISMDREQDSGPRSTFHARHIGCPSCPCSCRVRNI